MTTGSGRGTAPGYRAGYRRHVNRKRGIILLLLCAVASLAVLSVTIGSSGLSPGEVFRTLTGRGDWKTTAIVWNVRLPRIFTAIAVGSALSLAGCVMQCVLGNPLASASTLGVSQGASFGATVAIVVLGAGAQRANATAAGAVGIFSPVQVTLCAFAGGMATVAAILLLSRRKSITPAAMVLAGVALSSLFMGGATLVQYFADDVTLASAVFWTFGDLGRTGAGEIAIIASVTATALVYFIANGWAYNALGAGGRTARSLGVNVERLIPASMALCALLSATAVSFVGIINFVGLVAPHMVRRFVGDDFRYLLPASALAGACVLLASDLAGRTVAAPVVLPIGAITSFLGAPLFLYLIYKGAR